MYYVYFTRSYDIQERVAECRTLEAARLRAEEEFSNAARNVCVLSETGRLLYEPHTEEFLVDEF